MVLFCLFAGAESGATASGSLGERASSQARIACWLPWPRMAHRFNIRAVHRRRWESHRLARSGNGLIGPPHVALRSAGERSRQVGHGPGLCALRCGKAGASIGRRRLIASFSDFLTRRLES